MFRNLFPQKALGALLLTSSLIGTSVAAEVTLESLDGSLDIVGDLMSVDDTTFVIKTEFGELNVRREFVRCIGAECPTDESEANSDGGAVILTSGDGTIRLEGPLVDVTDTDFVIDTPSGVLTVRKEFVTCEGDACPQSLVTSEQIVVAVPDDIASDLLTAIISDYSSSKDFNVTQRFATADAGASVLVGNENGLEIARVGIKIADPEAAAKSILDGESAFAILNKRITPELLTRVSGREVADVSQLMRESIVGLDAISIVVTDRNSIDTINVNDVQAVLAGQITNWGQLGGADATITVHMVASSADTIIDQMRSHGMTGARIPANVILHDKASDMNAAVNADPSAIGVIYRSLAQNLKTLSLATACKVFVDDSDFAIQTEEYPLAVRWYSYADARTAPQDFARNLSEFIATDFGQQTLSERGLVTQELRTIPMQDQGARLLTSVLSNAGDNASQNVMRDYVDEVSNARRISTSLRFLSGSATLDNRAVSDLERISEIVRSREYEGYEVLVFGFSDSFGRLDANLSLSTRRAGSVRDILLSRNAGYLDDGNISVFGVGPIAPVYCNDTDQGRQQNRRVEIWIRPSA